MGSDVAETKTKLEEIGLTPGKAVLVGVLGVVLVGITYTKYVASDGSDVGPPLAESADTNAGLTVAPPTASAADSALPAEDAQAMVELDQSKWAPPELAAVVSFDPFALPQAFPQPARAVFDPSLAAEGTSAEAFQAQQLAEALEQMQRQLEELQQRGVHVIVDLRDERVAMIGDRTVRVGDEINGFIVTAIEPDGVCVERKGIE
jgi:hypothetical protein